MGQKKEPPPEAVEVMGSDQGPDIVVLHLHKRLGNSLLAHRSGHFMRIVINANDQGLAVLAVRGAITALLPS